MVQSGLRLLVEERRTDERADGNPVIKLGGKGKDRVVHDDQVLKATIVNDPKVLHEGVVNLDAVLTIQSMLEVAPLWIYSIYDKVCVGLFSSSENGHLIVCTEVLKAPLDVGSLCH